MERIVAYSDSESGGDEADKDEGSEAEPLFLDNRTVHIVAPSPAPPTSHRSPHVAQAGECVKNIGTPSENEDDEYYLPPEIADEPGGEPDPVAVKELRRIQDASISARLNLGQRRLAAEFQEARERQAKTSKSTAGTQAVAATTSVLETDLKRKSEGPQAPAVPKPVVIVQGGPPRKKSKWDSAPA